MLGLTSGVCLGHSWICASMGFAKWARNIHTLWHHSNRFTLLSIHIHFSTLRRPIHPHKYSFLHSKKKSAQSRTDSVHKSFKTTTILSLGEILRYRVNTPQNLLSLKNSSPLTENDPKFCVWKWENCLEQGRSPGGFNFHWKQICLVLRKAENWIWGKFTWVFDLQQTD